MLIQQIMCGSTGMLLAVFFMLKHHKHHKHCKSMSRSSALFCFFFLYLICVNKHETQGMYDSATDAVPPLKDFQRPLDDSQRPLDDSMAGSFRDEGQFFYVQVMTVKNIL